MPNFSKILIPLDFTQCSVDVLPYAKLMAEKFSAEIHLLYTLAGPEQFKGLSFEEDWSTTYGRVLKTESKRAMENFVQRHMQDFAPAGTAIRTGDTVEEIIDYADKK
ncbi:MAG: universal stress protein, partial [Thermodesulfobacteriota bacterium]